MKAAYGDNGLRGEGAKIGWLGVFNALSLIAAIGLSIALVVYGLGQDPYFMPTYDNSMLHAGRARVILDTGRWAEYELVFGGITKSYHLPFHPALAAGLSTLTGLNLWWAIRLVHLLFTGLLLPLAFYLLARKLSGSWMAGVAAAVSALAMPNILSWGTRTTPIGVGVVLVPLAFYFIAKKDYPMALATALAIAVDHQPSLLAFGLSFFLFFVANAASEAHKNGWEPFKRRLLFPGELRKEFSWLFAIGFLALCLYLGWHLRQTGTSCLDFKCLPQLSSHEYGSVKDFVALFAVPARFLAVLGITALAFTRRFDLRTKLLLFSWLLATLFLVKNDLIGLGVFGERFLTFFDESLAVFAGIFIAGLFEVLESKVFGKSSYAN